MLTTATAVFLLSLGVPPAGVGGPLPTGDGGILSCAAAPAHSLIGRKGNRRTAQEAQLLSGAREVRVIGHGHPYTANLRSDRLNLELNKRGRVRRISCF